MIGTGASGCMAVPEETLAALREAGIEVKTARTGKAVKIFNDLHGGTKRVAAALHLTC